jgi:hypothetical protein
VTVTTRYGDAESLTIFGRNNADNYATIKFKDYTGTTDLGLIFQISNHLYVRSSGVAGGTLRLGTTAGDWLVIDNGGGVYLGNQPAAGSNTAQVASTQWVNLNTYDGVDATSAIRPLSANQGRMILSGRLAQEAIQGGGTVVWNGSTVFWTGSRVISIPVPQVQGFAGGGYFELTMPAAGTVIEHHGYSAGNTTVLSTGVPLSGWEALYYRLPLDGNAICDWSRYVIVVNVGGWTPDAHWILVAAQNSDDGSLYFAPKRKVLYPGQSYADDRNLQVVTANTTGYAFTMVATPVNEVSMLRWNNSNNTVQIGQIFTYINNFYVRNLNGGVIYLGDNAHDVLKIDGANANVTLTGVPLSATAGTLVNHMIIDASNGTQDLMLTSSYRFAAGSDWTTANSKISRSIGSTEIASLIFGNTTGGSYNPYFAINLSSVEAFRVRSDGSISFGSSNAYVTKYTFSGGTTSFFSTPGDGIAINIIGSLGTTAASSDS